MKRLSIHLPGHLVGELNQDRHGMTRWLPYLGWESGGQRPRLGLDFLRKLGPRAHASDIPTWFENLLPERGSELRTRLCEAHGLRDGQSFDLLAAVGEDLIGAVEARRSGQLSMTLPVHGPESEGPSDAATSAEPPARLSALTGVQLKFSMSMVSERMVLPARTGEGLWIVKFPGTDYEQLAEVEAATMTWARAAGFAVPEHRVVPFEQLDGVPSGWASSSAPVFAVRRFDRRDDQSRVHQEDMCQALEVRPHNKYGNRDPLISFEGLLRAVDDTCGEDDAREVARRMGFIIASGNTDAHLKNWSLVWGDRVRPTISPCYDLVATISWSRFGWELRDGPTLALKLGRQVRFRNLSEAILDESARISQLAWFKEEALAGIERARQTWHEVAPLAPARMRDAVTRHWANVPLLERVGALNS